MRKRDLGILLISAFAVFISLQHEGNFSFREAWYHTPYDHYNPLEDEEVQPPAPIGFDLNGDGRKEVIFVTHEAKLQVVEPANPPASQSYQLGRVMKEVSLHPDAVSAGNTAHYRPVAMAVGYLDPPPPRGGSGPVSKGEKRRKIVRRKAVVVVVTADWTVFCYDHNLKQLWETSLQAQVPLGAMPKEISVLITNHTMHRGDRGMVIVGGRMESSHFVFSDPVGDEIREEQAEGAHQRAAGKADELEDVDEGSSGRKKTHFSYYAFEGGKGGMAWKHDSKDFHRDLAALSEQLLPQHNYKLDANAMTARHFGELECREYRASILHAALPHRWDHKSDTHFRLASFHRHRRYSHKRVQPRHRALPGHQAAVDHHHTPHGPPARQRAGRDHLGNVVAKAVGRTVEMAASGKKSKMGVEEHVHGNYSAHHWWAANAVVVHLKEGIEVIHLYSGRTVCKLLLPDGELHADVNGDGVIDHVKVTGAQTGDRFVQQLEEGPVTMRPCWAIATSGVPEREELFNGSICRPEHQGMDLQSAMNMHVDEFQYQHPSHSPHGPVEVAVPIHLPRHERERRRRRRHFGSHGDVIFLNSKGEMTSYATEGLHGKGGHGAHGHMRWQIPTEAYWTAQDPQVAGNPEWQSHHRARPSLLPMSLRAGGHAEVILAAGDTSAVIVSPTGRVLTTMHLPTAPSQPLMVMDFNGDRLNDIIVISSVGLYGFIQVRQPGAMFLSSMVGCLIVAICMAFVTLHLNAAPGKPRRGDKRSTD